VRPAFYALSPGGWRDYATLLHPPYTLWHLSYVIWGAALAGGHHYDRLAATLIAFFLAVGVAAHALDELQGRPLGTRISPGVLVVLACLGLGGAVLIGVLGAVEVSPWLLAFVAFGLFIAPAYNLEWFRGRFHSDVWFAASWVRSAPYRLLCNRRAVGRCSGARRSYGLYIEPRTTHPQWPRS
jgi:hypothetical protein